MTSPVMLIAAIVEALDAERAKNPGADLARAREIVLNTQERLAWEATRMDTDDMHRVQEPAYEVRHG